jgi:hypothetical protein
MQHGVPGAALQAVSEPALGVQDGRMAYVASVWLCVRVGTLLTRTREPPHAPALVLGSRARAYDGRYEHPAIFGHASERVGCAAD